MDVWEIPVGQWVLITLAVFIVVSTAFSWLMLGMVRYTEWKVPILYGVFLGFLCTILFVAVFAPFWVYAFRH